MIASSSFLVSSDELGRLSRRDVLPARRIRRVLSAALYIAAARLTLKRGSDSIFLVAKMILCSRESDSISGCPGTVDGSWNAHNLGGCVICWGAQLACGLYKLENIQTENTM